jgi:DNA-directed RNA polymerases I, II, and III subunit RPABC1
MAQPIGNIINIYKSRNTVLELLRRQGFDISQYEEQSMSEVHTMFQAKQMDMLLQKSNKKTYVKYHLAKTLRTVNIYEYIDDLYNLEQILNKTDNFIIIIKDEPNEPLVKELKNIWEKDNIFITVFNINRLQFNVLENNLVPPHRILSSEESANIRDKYNIINDKQFPDISRFSPVSMAIGIRPGDLCEIIRPSKTAINTKFYRICSS